MAYYLYMEDPTYIMLNQMIAQNNQLILETLLKDNRANFVAFLTEFNQREKLVLNCMFLNELQQVLRPMLIPQLTTPFIEAIKASQFIYVMQLTMAQNQDAFVANAMLQFLTMIVSADTMAFIEALVDEETSSLFWKNLTQLVLLPNTPAHSIIIDLMQHIFGTGGNAVKSVFPQCAAWVKLTLQQPQNP